MKKASLHENQLNSVSKKFRADIRSRISETCGTISLSTETAALCNAAVDRYIAGGEIPAPEESPIEVLIVFNILRAEIDRAAARSAAARRRASQRNLVKNNSGETDSRGHDTTAAPSPNPKAMRLAEIMTSEDPSDDEIDEVIRELLPLNRRQRRQLEQNRRKNASRRGIFNRG